MGRFQEKSSECQLMQNTVIQDLDWDKSPLIPAIIQDYNSQEVLMLGFVNQEALKLSLETGIMHYFSRSKNRIWKKGESSGHIQTIKKIKLDCDRDSLLIFVEQKGVACHTGEKSCFFRDLNAPIQTNAPQHTSLIQQDKILDTLYHILLDRKFASAQTSYTSSLYKKGINTICKKIAEECGELICELKDNNKEKIIYETADVFYHILVALAYFNTSPQAILEELQRRFAFSGIEEKNSRKTDA